MVAVGAIVSLPNSKYQVQCWYFALMNKNPKKCFYLAGSFCIPDGFTYYSKFPYLLDGKQMCSYGPTGLQSNSSYYPPNSTTCPTESVWITSYKYHDCQSCLQPTPDSNYQNNSWVDFGGIGVCTTAFQITLSFNMNITRYFASECSKININQFLTNFQILMTWFSHSIQIAFDSCEQYSSNCSACLENGCGYCLTNPQFANGSFSVCSNKTNQIKSFCQEPAIFNGDWIVNGTSCPS